MFNLHIQSLDLVVSHDLWIALITSVCAVVIAVNDRWRR
jgi:hypothetical protein